MIVLDASVLIAHLRSSDPHHAAASSLLRERADEVFAIHPVNLAEVLVGVVRSGRRQELLDALDAIGVATTRVDDDAPLRLAVLRVETGLKLPDCCALDAATSSEATLATADRRLAGAARERGAGTVLL